MCGGLRLHVIDCNDDVFDCLRFGVSGGGGSVLEVRSGLMWNMNGMRVSQLSHDLNSCQQ